MDKIQYSQFNPVDTLTVNGKAVKKKDPKLLQYSAQFAINWIRLGKSLSDIPADSQILPPLFEILTYIDGNHALKTDKEHAERHRLHIVKENLIKTSEAYAKSGSATDRDLFKAQAELHDKLAKAAQQETHVEIQFNTLMPEDFWSNKKTQDEHTPWERSEDLKTQIKEDKNERI